ncbi:MAG: hypothetical protein NAOJABEB_01934 [Steroidobacteraceae bacterium]|nr:hypothetical protein [Steroidobacteraceae bacterium]
MPRPVPVPTAATRPFWNALADNKLRLQRCRACATLFHYPRACCPACLSPDLEWCEVAGTGTLYTFTISRRPTHPLFVDEVPQRLAVVELDEGPKLTTTLINVRDADIHIGMRVAPVFERQADGKSTLLRYQPVDEALRAAAAGTSGAARGEQSAPATTLLTPEVLACIGRTGEPVTGYPVTVEEIRRYCFAVDDLNPRWLDAEQGSAAAVAPPMFVSVPFETSVPLRELAEDGTVLEHKGLVFPPLGARRKLFGGLEIEWFRELHPGDTLTRQYKVLDIFERRGASGPAVFVRIEGTYNNQHGETVAVEVNTIICR